MKCSVGLWLGHFLSRLRSTWVDLVGASSETSCFYFGTIPFRHHHRHHNHLHDRTFHTFKALKSIDWRFWTAQNSSNAGFYKARKMSGSFSFTLLFMHLLTAIKKIPALSQLSFYFPLPPSPSSFSSPPSPFLLFFSFSNRKLFELEVTMAPGNVTGPRKRTHLRTYIRICIHKTTPCQKGSHALCLASRTCKVEKKEHKR